MPFKNQDLGWIRVNFKREADKALRDFMSKTNLAPVDWYEDLDEETKEAYNKSVLDKTANTYSLFINSHLKKSKLIEIDLILIIQHISKIQLQLTNYIKQ